MSRHQKKKNSVNGLAIAGGILILLGIAYFLYSSQPKPATAGIIESDHLRLITLSAYDVNDKCCFVLNFKGTDGYYQINACPVTLNSEDREVLKREYNVSSKSLSYMGTEYLYTLPFPEDKIGMQEEFREKIVPQLEPLLNERKNLCQ